MKHYCTHLANRILRSYGAILSDEHVKTIEDNTDLQELAAEIIQQGPPFNDRQVEILVKAAGEMDDDRSFNRDGHIWKDEVLDAYADHILNYKYKYNEEALKVDPETDLDKEHIGPMAQDIEKVNPAAVYEDPETGYKKVDAGRVALMNAGAIAELARQVREMQKHA
jgi:hypothetical protein